MKKSTLIAVGAFVVLLGAWLATRETQVNEGVPRLELPAVTQAQVTRIEVTGPSKATLTLDDGRWHVASPDAPDARHDADEGLVRTALTQLEALKPGDFITRRPEKQAELEVDDAKGLHVKVPGVGLDVVLGKAAQGGGFYLRKAGSDAIFTGAGGLAMALRRDVDGWRKKAIDAVKADEVAKVSVTSPDGAVLVLAKGDEGWALHEPLPRGFRFDADAARQLVERLAGLRAQGFEAKTPDEAAPGTTFVVTRKEGKTTRLKVGEPREDGTSLLTVEGDAQTYVLPKWTVEPLTKGLDGVRRLTLVDIDVSKVTGLTITTAKGKTVAKRTGEAWALVEPKSPPAGVEVDVATIPSVVQRLAAMRAARAVEVPAAKAGLSKPTAEVVFTVEGKPAQVIRFGADAGDGQVYVSGTADPAALGLVYAMPVFQRDELQKGAALFEKPKPPPNFGGGGLESLPPDIRRQLEAQLKARGGQ